MNIIFIWFVFIFCKCLSPWGAKENVMIVQKKKLRRWTSDSELRNWGLKFKEPSVLKLLKQIWTNSKIFSIEYYFELGFTYHLNHAFLLFSHSVSCDILAATCRYVHILLPPEEAVYAQHTALCCRGKLPDMWPLNYM